MSVLQSLLLSVVASLNYCSKEQLSFVIDQGMCGCFMGFFVNCAVLSLQQRAVGDLMRNLNHFALDVSYLLRRQDRKYGNTELIDQLKAGLKIEMQTLERTCAHGDDHLA